MARALRELFGSWFRLLKNFHAKYGSLDKLKLAWLRCPAQNCRGMIYNVKKTLISIAWQPVQLDVWISPEGEHWQLQDLDFPVHLIIKELIDSYNLQQLQRAALHRNGHGMASGVAWESPATSL